MDGQKNYIQQYQIFQYQNQNILSFRCRVFLLILLFFGMASVAHTASWGIRLKQIKGGDQGQKIVLVFDQSVRDYQMSIHGKTLSLWLPRLQSITTEQLKQLTLYVAQATWQPEEHLLKLNFNFPVQAKGQLQKQDFQLIIHRQHRIDHSKFISLSVHHLPAEQLLQWLGRLNGDNLLIRGEVNQSVTIELHHVRWHRAFQAIINICGLHAQKQHRIWLVEPLSSLLKRQQLRFKEQKIAQQLKPLESVSLPIRYARVSDMVKLLKTMTHHLLLTKATISGDKRTNMLLVRALPDHIERIKQLLSGLDIPVREVAISSRMVMVHDDITQELGIHWQIGAHPLSQNGTGDHLNILLPVVAPTSQIAFKLAKLGNSNQLGLELSALEQENKGKIIANPRITTTNRQSAYIEQGREIPYVESAASGATSVTFKKAVLSLKVTPQITPDNHIILELLITQNSEGEAVDTPTGRAVAINTQEIQTRVQLKSGETIVLGGIYQQQQSKVVSRVPFLGNLPGIGALFRHTANVTRRNELLIFVTPRIVK
ncbi:MAG: Type 3 secretion system secretin [Candidatus Celerinatantimonas neptuna]|nr:MAG: Type 3 secretion system secretin [Candidatus Celerinatantimonas neptuna]